MSLDPTDYPTGVDVDVGVGFGFDFAFGSGSDPKMRDWFETLLQTEEPRLRYRNVIGVVAVVAVTLE